MIGIKLFKMKICCIQYHKRPLLLLLSLCTQEVDNFSAVSLHKDTQTESMKTISIPRQQAIHLN